MDFRSQVISDHATGQTSPTSSRSLTVKRSNSMDGQTDDRLKKACSDFEGIFLNMMVQTMKKTIPKDGILGKSHQSEVFDSMFFQEISSQLARERGLGIGDALYRQVRRQMIEGQEK
jgi:peptidoglycan hydrolase FlgJ